MWSQFRRGSRNGTRARALTVLHAAAREADGRTEATPSMVVIGVHAVPQRDCAECGTYNIASTTRRRSGACLGPRLPAC